jgi:hypothetical protein
MAARSIRGPDYYRCRAVAAAPAAEFLERLQFDLKLNCAVIRQYSSTAKFVKAKQNRSGSGVFLLAIGPCNFSFQLSNLSAHLHDLPLQSFLGHKERTQQVPTQLEEGRNRLE